MKPSQILRERGWCQFEIEDDKGRLCVLGALLKVYGNEYGDPLRRLKNHLVTEWAYEWNNAPGRTKEEVIAALEAIGE